MKGTSTLVNVLTGVPLGGTRRGGSASLGRTFQSLVEHQAEKRSLSARLTKEKKGENPKKNTRNSQKKDLPSIPGSQGLENVISWTVHERGACMGGGERTHYKKDFRKVWTKKRRAVLPSTKRRIHYRSRDGRERSSCEHSGQKGKCLTRRPRLGGKYSVRGKIGHKEGKRNIPKPKKKKIGTHI